MNMRNTLSIAVLALLASAATTAQTAPAKAKIDANGDGVITKAEAAAFPKLAQRFDQLDVNKDGKLSADERRAMHPRNGRDGARMHEARATLFADADANKDGRLSRDEFIVEHSARAAEREQQRAQRAGEAGKQKPARPQPTEAERQQHIGAMFDRMDANKDGTVTKAEFDAFKPKPRGDGQPPAKPAPVK
ncbi:MAG: EF-hand domain-containing protein [Thermomonas sp.]|uniref:EF-hand domain-containing protein n=1 Tax=Thermomonas sp. TaxID=1971895 RepID=UPI0039E410DA